MVAPAIPGPGRSGHPAPSTLALVSTSAQRLAEREASIVRSMTELLSGIERLDDDPRMLDLLESSIAANINTILQVLHRHLPIEQLQPTTAAVAYAAYVAQRGIPANALVRAYHMGQEDLLERFYEEVELLECSPTERFEVMRYVSAVLYRYIDWITLYLLEVYEDEKRRWDSTRSSVHTSLVTRVLTGEPGAGGSLSVATGYDLDQHHIALIAWLPHTAAHTQGLPEVERFVRDLHERVGRRGHPLVTAADRSTVWAWLPRGTDARPLPDRELHALLDATQGVHAAVGLPAPGELGFRRSHEQADAARQVALTASQEPTTLSYGDDGVAVVSVLARDLNATRDWVRQVLGALAADDDNAARLRETVRIYLANGASATEAAAILHLHRNSVRYRIERAEELRGRSVGEGRLDVELALQTCHLLGASVLS